MDKQVEIVIIAGLIVIAVVSAWLLQWNLVTVIVFGLIGFLSHGYITPTETASVPASEPEQPMEGT